MDDLWETIQAGEQYSLRAIPGIELSVKEHLTFHILGYGFSSDAPALQDLCRRMKSRRDKQSQHLLAFLYDKGIELYLSEVKKIAGGDIISRPHFTQAMAS